ncbi:Cytoplasmic 60S subunit biogenesis factor REI1 1 [Chlorella vulgaris]
MAGPQEQEGLYCSTAGTYFNSKEDLEDHYRSDFHRYNLKRKIAGMPPVTREWYEVRKAQLLATSATPVQRVWFDPLTKRKFYSENTYQTFARSKKYQDLVKKSGGAAPAPIVTLRRVDEGSSAVAAAAAPAAPASLPQQQHQQGKAAGFTVKPAVKSAAAGGAAGSELGEDVEEEEQEEEADEGSDWETVSEEEMETDQKWEEWDVRRSLFDNHESSTMEDNLEYMFKNFGFYFPDSQYLTDPEGLLKYLGAKLQYGHVPLYESGDSPEAKQFLSLHAVQRHMVDTNQCKMFFEGGEEEYEEYYDYGEEEGEGEDADMAQAGGALVVSAAEAGPSAAYELVLANGGGGGGKIIGSREFARYYRQRPRLGDGRASVQAATVLAQYRRLSVPLLEGPGASETLAVKKQWKRGQLKHERLRFKMDLNYDKINNLPKNVPY